MARKRTEYAIYKKLDGVRFPGDFWDGPWDSKAEARKKFNKSYKNPGSERNQDFHIIKTTYEKEDT
jgi:hypothetical protein